MCGGCFESSVDPEEPVALSALQHYLFCPRQCALIHIEQAWSENRSTAEGRLFHAKVHGEETRVRDGIVTSRGLRLVSKRLGLAGVADAVEFHPVSDGETQGVRLPGRPGRWLPLPVEYKKGRKKDSLADIVQLCAQALCLEEMLGTIISRGAVFYGRSRRRCEVCFDSDLRRSTEETALAVSRLLASGKTPPASYGGKCKDCSLRELCCPEQSGKASGRVASYVKRQLALALDETKE